jgi:hypothetical protein
MMFAGESPLSTRQKQPAEACCCSLACVSREKELTIIAMRM